MSTIIYKKVLYCMKLKEWRNKKGWSQEDLAKSLNTTQESISYWENEEIMPRKEILKSIIELTNGKVTANDFI